MSSLKASASLLKLLASCSFINGECWVKVKLFTTKITILALRVIRLVRAILYCLNDQLMLISNSKGYLPQTFIIETNFQKLKVRNPLYYHLCRMLECFYCDFLLQVDIIKHFLARATFLIAVPAVCYMIIFAVHFKVLSKRSVFYLSLVTMHHAFFITLCT